MTTTVQGLDTFTNWWDSTSATARGTSSTRTSSTASPMPPATTSGSTWIRSGPKPGLSAAAIAHGYLTLSLVSRLLARVWTVKA